MRLPRMTTRRWMVVVVVIAVAIGVSIFSQRWLQRRQRIEQMRRDRVTSALKAYTGAEKALLSGEIDPETFYLWSRRLMECQLEVSRSKADRIAAIRTHEKRLSILRDPEGTGKTCWDERTLAAMDFFRKEAEFWLAQEE